ncbi:hypothetical protein [Acutalibacter muris]|nr:hypothetical protein [Acutalibacter muris]
MNSTSATAFWLDKNGFIEKVMHKVKPGSWTICREKGSRSLWNAN